MANQTLLPPVDRAENRVEGERSLVGHHCLGVLPIGVGDDQETLDFLLHIFAADLVLT